MVDEKYNEIKEKDSKFFNMVMIIEVIILFIFVIGFLIGGSVATPQTYLRCY